MLHDEIFLRIGRGTCKRRRHQRPRPAAAIPEAPTTASPPCSPRFRRPRPGLPAGGDAERLTLPWRMKASGRSSISWPSL
jgi:hypothetical protein